MVLMSRTYNGRYNQMGRTLTPVDDIHLPYGTSSIPKDLIQSRVDKFRWLEEFLQMTPVHLSYISNLSFSGVLTISSKTPFLRTLSLSFLPTRLHYDVLSPFLPIYRNEIYASCCKKGDCQTCIKPQDKTDPSIE